MGANEEIIARLNELLEAERAGVEALAALAREQPKGFLRNQLEKMGRDESVSCAGLVRAIRALGGQPSEATGDFAAKVMALDGLVPRLALLARGQAWVSRRLRALADAPLDPESRRFLDQMLKAHDENVAWCNRATREWTIDD